MPTNIHSLFKKVQERPVCLTVYFSCSFTGCKCSSDRGTDGRWKLSEAPLGCSCSVYPGYSADADLRGGIKQTEYGTNRYGSCNRHGCGTRPQLDRWPPGPPGGSSLHSQWTGSCLAPVPGGLCCCRPQRDFPPACHSHRGRSSPQNWR